MAQIQYTLKIDDAQARALLAQLQEADTRDLLARLGQYLQDSTQARFKSQTGPDGQAWAPLQPNYAKSKKYNKDKVLTLRGYLRAGIRHQIVAPDAVLVGTDTKYAAIHQFGGTIEQHAQSRRQRFRTVAGRTLFAKNTHKRATERWVTRSAYTIDMPARPFLGVNAADETALLQRVQEWLDARLGRA